MENSDAEAVDAESRSLKEQFGRIGFGGMPLSTQGRPSDEQGRTVLEAVIEAGLTFIDTADVYCLDDDDLGHNERLIASVVKSHPRVRVGTKAGLRRPKGAWTNDGSPAHIREACERSLRALSTDRIWLYQFHAPDPKVPFAKSIEAFAQLQQAGKFEHFGLSNVSIPQIDEASAILPVVSVQNRLNPYFRESIDVAEECARRGITFLAYSPVGGGRLAKKLPKFENLQALAARHGRSVHAIVLAWVRLQAKSVVPIPAARTIEHALDSANSVDVVLTPEDVAEIDRYEFSRA